MIENRSRRITFHNVCNKNHHLVKQFYSSFSQRYVCVCVYAFVYTYIIYIIYTLRGNPENCKCLYKELIQFLKLLNYFKLQDKDCLSVSICLFDIVFFYSWSRYALWSICMPTVDPDSHLSKQILMCVILGKVFHL